MWQPDSQSLSDTVLFYCRGTLTTLPPVHMLAEILFAQQSSLPTASFALSISGLKKLAGMDIGELSIVLANLEVYATSANDVLVAKVCTIVAQSAHRQLAEKADNTLAVITKRSTSLLNAGLPMAEVYIAESSNVR